MSEDLWGDISVDRGIKLPVTILKEQATILGEKTNKILEAKVYPLGMSDKERVGYYLNIIAPALSNYKFEVLSIDHPALFVYPLNLHYKTHEGAWTSSVCKDETEFISKLKEVLSSEIVHKVIASLIAQSKATT
ncbi:MAG TPA: hypothetical protein VF571_16095 [Pyrinomonadaceae bacterium]|jgi:hypothetical protein